MLLGTETRNIETKTRTFETETMKNRSRHVFNQLHRRRCGGAENAGLENAGVAKMQGWKTRHQTAGVENAGLENAGV